MLEKRYVIEYIDSIIEVIENKYCIEHKLASSLVKDSSIYRMAFKDPDYIMHYDVEDWADEIMKNCVMA